MKDFILIALSLYLGIQIVKNMNSITKYFDSVLTLIIGVTPVGVGLLIFDHSMLSNSDILKDTGMWFWVGICLMYTACFAFLYSINLPLIHPLVWEKFNIDYEPSKEDWRAYTAQMALYSFISIGITYFLNGNFIHFIGNSLIVALTINILLVITYLLLRYGINKI